MSEKVSFQDTGGRECPAGTTLTLIFHWGDGSFLSPINRRSNVIESNEFHHLSSDFRNELSEVSLLELLVSQVEEHGLTISGLTFRFIEGLDVFDIVIEDLESIAVFT